MAGRKRKDYTKKRVLDAIKDSGGIISNVARALGCSWHIADRNIKRYPEAVAALADEEESMLDDVEEAGFKLARQGDGSMIRFYLSTKGRKRGYITDDKQAPNAANNTDNTVHLVIDTKGGN